MLPNCGNLFKKEINKINLHPHPENLHKDLLDKRCSLKSTLGGHYACKISGVGRFAISHGIRYDFRQTKYGSYHPYYTWAVEYSAFSSAPPSLFSISWYLSLTTDHMGFQIQKPQNCYSKNRSSLPSFWILKLSETQMPFIFQQQPEQNSSSQLTFRFTFLSCPMLK